MNETIPANAEQYAGMLQIGLAIYLGVSGLYWSQIALKSDSHKYDRILLALATLLGACWILPAWIEGRYLVPVVGQTLPYKFHYSVLGFAALALVWNGLMYFAYHRNVLWYCLLYAGYTTLTTLAIAPSTNRIIVQAVSDAVQKTIVSSEIGHEVIHYYAGQHWTWIGGISIGLSWLALWAAVRSRNTDRYRLSHIALLFEFFVVQGALFYFRFNFYDRI